MEKTSCRCVKITYSYFYNRLENIGTMLVTGLLQPHDSEFIINRIRLHTLSSRYLNLFRNDKIILYNLTHLPYKNDSAISLIAKMFAINIRAGTF